MKEIFKTLLSWWGSKDKLWFFINKETNSLSIDKEQAKKLYKKLRDDHYFDHPTREHVVVGYRGAGVNLTQEELRQQELDENVHECVKNVRSKS